MKKKVLVQAMSSAVGRGWSTEHQGKTGDAKWWSGHIVTEHGVIATEREKGFAMALFVFGGRLHRLIVLDDISSRGLVRIARAWSRSIVHLLKSEGRK